MKFLFGMCDCMVDSDVGTGEFSLVLGILHVCGQVHMRSHVSQGMNCCCDEIAKSSLPCSKMICSLNGVVIEAGTAFQSSSQSVIAGTAPLEESSIHYRS